MKPTNFAYYLTNFFTKYLPVECGLSPNTISSYRDTFLLFIAYVNRQCYAMWAPEAYGDHEWLIYC